MGLTCSFLDFDFKELSKDHYCRFRNDDEGEDDSCCDEEDQDSVVKRTRSVFIVETNLKHI